MLDLKTRIENHPIRWLAGVFVGTTALCFLIIPQFYAGMKESKNAKIELLQDSLAILGQATSKYQQNHTHDSLMIIALKDSLERIRMEISKFKSKEVLPATTLCKFESAEFLSGELVVAYRYFDANKSVASVYITSPKETIFQGDFRLSAEQKTFEYKGKQYVLKFFGFVFYPSKDISCIKLSIYRK